MLQSDYCVARVLEQWPHHRPEARDQYRGRGRYCDGRTCARQHDGCSTVQNTECNARPIRLLPKPAQPGEDCLLGRRTDQSESFASKISRDNRLLTTEWVSLRKDDAPALLPQLFDGQPIRVLRLRLRGKCEIDDVSAQSREHLPTRQFDQLDQDIW
jgi:hypothetical protein